MTTRPRDGASTGPELELLGEGFAFLESPRWRCDRLWVVDIFGGQVLGFSSRGEVERMLDVDAPAGLGWDADERLLVVSADGRILRDHNGRLLELSARIQRGSAPCNELTLDAHGRAFVGIFGLRTGGLVRLDPDGFQRVVATDLLLPNGQALTPDQQTLFVAESAGQRVTAFTVTRDGELTDRRVWASFGPPASATSLTEVVRQIKVWPDGIALDRTGGIWVANPFGHEVVRVRQGGQVTDRISTGPLSAYACAVGGADGRTLFVCAAAPSLDETTRRAQRGACLLATRLAGPAADMPSQDDHHGAAAPWG